MTELEKTKNTGIAVTPKMGLEEHVDSSDLILPRLMLIQNTPPKNVTIDRKQCPPGTLINSITAQPLKVDENGGVPFFPIIRGVKWIMFNAQDKDKPNFDANYEEGAKIWESRDPRDPNVIKYGEWTKDEQGNSVPPRATKFIEFLVIVPTEDMPLILGFAKTSFAAGKQLTSMVTYTKKPAIFGDKYRLSVKEDKNEKKQSYFVLTISKIGDASETEFAECKNIFDGFAGKNLKAHGDEEAAEPVAARQPWE